MRQPPPSTSAAVEHPRAIRGAILARGSEAGRRACRALSRGDGRAVNGVLAYEAREPLRGFPYTTRNREFTMTTNWFTASSIVAPPDGPRCLCYFVMLIARLIIATRIRRLLIRRTRLGLCPLNVNRGKER
ncbi:hypothetical protein GCM10020220_096420 [Nonomuraea rubra]